MSASVKVAPTPMTSKTSAMRNPYFLMLLEAVALDAAVVSVMATDHRLAGESVNLARRGVARLKASRGSRGRRPLATSGLQALTPTRSRQQGQ